MDDRKNYSTNYYQKNKERICRHQREYYKKHREEILKRLRIKKNNITINDCINNYKKDYENNETEKYLKPNFLCVRCKYDCKFEKNHCENFKFKQIPSSRLREIGIKPYWRIRQIGIKILKFIRSK